MVVKIGHASTDENGKARGGKPGDQTTKEVVIQDWYQRHWATVFRAKDTKIAEKIAKTMEQACSNNNIGYDQGQRTTLYENAKLHSWDISKIKEKCECDCSSLVAVCVIAAGINISKDMYTGNQKAVLSATGKFDILTDFQYLAKPDNLKRGDILLASGHTAVVLSNDKKANNIDSAKSFSKALAGNYKVAAEKLNLRCGAGIDKSVLTVLLKNTLVKCYGYYTKISGTDWLYVQVAKDNEQYFGFISSKYLVKNQK